MILVCSSVTIRPYSSTFDCCNFSVLKVEFILGTSRKCCGGIDVPQEVTTTNHREEALELLKKDADKIFQLIKVQMDNLTMPQCPLYEEVLDTQMFGLSREIDFAVRLSLVTEKDGKALLDALEQELSALHEASQKR